MDAAPAAMPPNPKTAATMATMKNIRLYIVFAAYAFFAIFNLLSCKVSENLSKTSGRSGQSKSIPRIIFLNYSLAYDSLQQEYILRLLNKIITEGKLKNTIDSKNPVAGDLAYSVLDKDMQILYGNYVASPLERTVEYTDNNGRMGKKDIRLDSTQFSLRIPLDPAARFISMELYKGGGSENVKLLLIDLLKE
jgi:hypothetical protein